MTIRCTHPLDPDYQFPGRTELTNINDAFGKHPDIEVVPMHHEQSASMAAEGYYRETGKVAVCQVTTGTGGANAITGCAGAWVDSEASILPKNNKLQIWVNMDSDSRMMTSEVLKMLNILRAALSLHISKDFSCGLRNVWQHA